MSGASDNFEDALWNNSFYSSQGVILLLESSNHIFNLQRTVNIPHLILTSLVAAGLNASAKSSANTSSATTSHKTLLMRVSPSMKALESVLNGPAAAGPSGVAPILEEEPQLEEPPLTNHPGILVLSFQTAKTAHSSHTTQSAQSAALDETVPLSALPQSPQPPESPATTGVDSGYSTNDSTPRLHQPAAFHVVKHVTKDYSPRLTTTATSFPVKEDGQNLAQGGLATKHKAETTQPGTSAKAQASQKPKFPSSDSKPLSDPPFSEKPLLDEKPLSALDAQTPAEKKPLDLPVQRPIRSMLDSPIIGHQKLEPAASPKLAEPFRPQPAPASPQKTKTPSQLSAFATPRSHVSRMSPHTKSHSDVVPASPGGVSSHKRSSTMSDIAGRNNSASTGTTSTTGSNSSTTSAQSKRFSLRGMFKIKSRNHLLDKLAGVKEIVEPSKPAKLRAKSFSSPNILEAAAEPKKDSRRSFFGKRKKSEADLTAYQVPVTSKPLPQPAQKEVPPKPVQKVAASPELPKTPATAYSAATQLTPVTAELNPNTIREVDDSDYLPAFDPEQSSDGEDELLQPFDPPTRRSPGEFREELSLEPTGAVSGDWLSLNPKDASTSFGSPFAVSYSPAQSSVARTPRIVHPSKNLTFSPKEPEAERQHSPKPNDSLLGDTLFPKSLNPHEVESIVSLERSRSMRSIKSNGKRSSFINYTGSDENIVLGRDPAFSRSNSIIRSGSILKNSLSSKSLCPEPVQLLDAAMVASPQGIQETVEPEPVLEQVPNLDSEPLFDDSNLHDFIEFTDFIDVDNLDFSTLPRQFGSELSVRLFTPDVNVEPIKMEEPEPVAATNLFSATSAPSGPSLPDILVDRSVLLEDEVPPLSEETALHRPRLDVVVVDSETSLELETPQTPPRTNENAPSQDPLKSPIMDTAYKMAMNEVVARESPSTAARPVSMSFKGFSGSTLQGQVFVRSGSHQLVHLYNDSSNESSAVGKGFGSSDEEDDESDDDYSFDEGENDPHANGSAAARVSPTISPGLKQNGSVANRRQVPGPPHLASKTLGLQPPPSIHGPFHHDRIPSLSDHSATSSPRLLSSFISRIKRSPAGSPKIAFTAKAGVRFSSRIVLYDTYNGDEYDRHPDTATCNQLTPLLAQQIKEELNEFKAEMHIHRDSQCYTHFF